MAAFTSKATGNWASAGQTTWNEVGVPVAGDTATIQAGHTVTVAAATVATLGLGTVTTALTVNAGGALIIAGTLNVRGNIVITSSDVTTTTLQLNGGGILNFDNSTAINNSYTCTLGSGGTGSVINSFLKTSGTSAGSHATVQTVNTTGTGRGSFVAGAANAFDINISYVDFLDLGTAAVDALAISMSNYASVGPNVIATHTVTHCTFIRCGRVNLDGTGYGHLVYTFNAHVSPLSWSARFTWFNATGENAPATRTIQDNSFDAIDFAFSNSNQIRFDRNYHRGPFTGVPTGTGLSFTNNFIRGIEGGEVQLSNPWGDASNVVKDSYLFCDERQPGNQHYIEVAAGYTYDGLILETSLTADVDSDGFLMSSAASGNGLVTVKNCHVLPNAGGTKSGCLVNAGGNNLTTYAITHNTVCTSGGNSGIFLGEVNASVVPGFFAQVKNNLFWKGASTYAFWNIAGASFYTGTATAGSSSTVLNDTTKTFPTAANTLLVNWTLKMTSGVNSGLSRLVTTNTATSVTVSPAFPSAIGTGDAYDLYPVDVCVEGQMDYNGMFQIASGTVRDALNANPTSKVGYNNWRVTTIANVGLHDVSGDPVFVDTTRNLPTFASAYLGYTNASVDSTSVAKGAWAVSTSYAVGDVVSNPLAAHYNNATILYRCLVAHTSAASDKPGDNTVAWRTNWEYYSLYTLRIGLPETTGAHANAKVANLLTWVRAGFQPTSQTYKAASDNVTPSNGWIGAVAGAGGAAPPAALLDPAVGAIARYWEGLPGNRATLTLADQTATSATLAMGTPIRNIKVLLYCKTFTAGTGTIGPKWELQVADNASFTTNVRTLALNYGPRAVHAVVLQGVVPDNFLASWVKIKVTLSGTDTVAYDVKGDAA